MIITRKSSIELTESRAKYITYKNYLQFFSTYITDKYPSLINVKSTYNSIIIGKTFTAKGYKQSIIKKILFNAWNSELVHRCYSILPESFLSLINHWKPVQLYYSLYFLSEAICTWIEGKECKSHQTVINFINNIILTKQSFLPPWNFIYTDLPVNKYTNFPIGYTPKYISSLSMTGNSSDSIAMWLRTTHEEKRNNKWSSMSKTDKSKHRKSGKKKKDLYVSPTSFFDCLFRFRKWSNYDEAEAFLSGPENEQESTDLSSYIANIQNYSMFMIELNCKIILRPALFLGIFEEYIKLISSKVQANYLTERFNLLK